jgi:uncharacterized protein
MTRALFILLILLGTLPGWSQTNQVATDKRIADIQAAAEKGEAVAQFEFGMIYGNVGAYERSLEWLKKSADQGYDRAQQAVGRAYSLGMGVERNSKEAAVWFQKAADQGHGRACFDLATLYMKGNGLTRDWIEAHKWFLVSYRLGYTSAGRMVREMENRNIREKEMEAERRAMAWLIAFGKTDIAPF